MLDAEVTAQLIELMLAGGSALAQAKQAIGKLLAIVHCPAVVCRQTMRGGENGPGPHPLPPLTHAAHVLPGNGTGHCAAMAREGGRLFPGRAEIGGHSRRSWSCRCG